VAARSLTRNSLIRFERRLMWKEFHVPSPVEDDLLRITFGTNRREVQSGSSGATQLAYHRPCPWVHSSATANVRYCPRGRLSGKEICTSRGNHRASHPLRSWTSPPDPSWKLWSCKPLPGANITSASLRVHGKLRGELFAKWSVADSRVAYCSFYTAATCVLSVPARSTQTRATWRFSRPSRASTLPSAS
jgi:hypothetical protein